MTYNTPTHEEMTFLASIKNQKRYGKNEREMLYHVYNRLHNTHIRPTTCGSCLAKRHKELMKIYNTEINKPKL